MTTILWTLGDWARAIAALPAPAPLPCRTVLVPSEAVAHGLRRELVRLGLASALGGTRFVPEPAAAVEVLHAAGVEFQPGEEGLRAARLLGVFRAGLALEHFPADLLLTRPGWDEAFAHTLGDLEAAGLRPEDLERQSGGRGRLGDLARIWHAADGAAGASWTRHRIHAEAARALERAPGAWPYPGAALAVVDGHASGVRARFLRAIPGVTLALAAARPLRAGHLDRVEALLGAAAREALGAAVAARAGASERDVLAAFLFEPPAVLADPARPRSAGPDGTVDLEEHAGLEEEIEAAADWVAAQVLAGVPLEDIAVLVPGDDALGALVAERLVRLPWHDGALPVHVAGGLPLAGQAAGARALAVIRALRAHLAGEALGGVLPALRTGPAGEADGPAHLAHGAALDLVWSLGTAGGTPAHPAGALEWSGRAAAREPALQALLERAREAADDPEQAGVARRARDLERLLGDLRAIRPALDALVAVARLAVDGAPLASLWPALRDFLGAWLLQPGAGPRVQAILDERLQPLAADATCGRLAGDDALRVVEDAAVAARLPAGRFGEAAVYVGTIAGARALAFRAVRVLGLAEGHFPRTPREDPVLPDAERRRLAAPGADGRPLSPVDRADRVLADLHALDHVVRNATERVALSMARLDAERSQREASSVVLEAAAALARPSAATGERGGPIPDAAALRRDAFAPARRRRLDARRATPLGEAAWQDGVAGAAFGLPARWRARAATDPVRVVALARPGPAGAADGLLGAGADAVAVPGLAADRPISPSALERLLRCPHMFLLERVLGFEEPAEAPSLREIGQPAYGSLVHRVAEAFYREHGEAFCRREGTLDGWLSAVEPFVDRAFDAFVEEYPLPGHAVRGAQHDRLRRDVLDLVQYDWTSGAGRRFVAVERSFGRPQPVELAVGHRALFLRGQIDRLDVAGPRTLVRDLKTGRAYPRLGRDAEPEPTRDVQIAVYGLITRRLAREWGVPDRIATAYAYVGRGAEERAWRDDFHERLEPAAREWLAVAADLLAARAFPRTPRPGDCAFCAFRPVCGEEVYERAAEVLAAGDPVLARFRATKGLAEEPAG
jgi:hypothetical protein